MAAKSFNLTFDGYWRESNISGLPEKSGIYGAYACTYDATAKAVDPKRLLYVGEAADINGRIANHDKWGLWRSKVLYGEQLCFNAALITGADDRQRAEAAEIFKHKPPCNTNYVDSFPFDQTSISNGGRAALLVPRFAVYRTEVAAKAYRWI